MRAIVLFRSLVATATLTAGLALAPPASADDAEKDRAEIRAKVDEVLADLHRLQPSAKSAIQKAAGYAVFSNFGTKILLVGGGAGKGMAFDNATGKATYMKMVELQTGLGLGVKKFGLVWVFAGKPQLDGFVNSGWEFGAQATAAAKYDDQGGGFQGAVPISEGVYLYQITDAGLAAELTVKGTKYYKDADLN